MVTGSIINDQLPRVSRTWVNPKFFRAPVMLTAGSKLILMRIDCLPDKALRMLETVAFI